MSSYNDYELTIYPVNGRALPVSSVVNTVDKTITFNNLIRYDRANNRVLEFKNNAWTVIPNYFSSDYTGTKIYQNNLYSSVKTDILNKEQFDLSKPWKYMMYGPSGDVSMVTSITLANNIYTFTSDIGKVDFDTQGNPITYFTLRFVVYKYDGFSQMTSSYLKYLYDVLKPESGCQVTRNGFKYVDFSSPDCKIDVASWLKIYIYGGIVGWQGGQQFVVDKIIKSIDDPGWDLLFYITDGNSQKGIAFKKDGTPLFTHYTGGSGSFGGISYDSYLIYRKDGFTNFTPNTTKVIPLDIMINPSVYLYLKSDPSISGGEINLTNLTFRKTITREITYQITNPIDKFQIVIPNDKPTNRIFVYQSGTNKLVHITNYIPKGTTQNVTIDYSQGVKSSVTPVYPLPVPNFYRNNKMDGIENVSKRWGQNPRLPVNCPDGSVLVNLDGASRWYGGNTEEHGLMTIKGKCKNIYSGEISYTPSASAQGGWGGLQAVSTSIDKNGYREAEVWNQDTIVDIKLKEANGNTLSFFTDNAKNSTIWEQGPMETWNNYDVKYYNCENGKLMGLRGRGDGGCYDQPHQDCHQISIGFNCGDVSIK